MKISLLSMSVATLLASNSITALAANVTIPNTFTSGTPAVAAEVNDNFSAVATGVNDNDARITTNTSAITTNTTATTTNAGGISTNAAGIATNTADIATNTADVATNTADIATNTADVATNTADIATNATDIATNASDIATLQGAVNCSTDMVAVGPLCVDIYEASVWDSAAGTGTQYGDGVDDYPIACLDDGNGCAGQIFAVSKVTVNPSRSITWYQAAQACANVGKRLPSTAEWVMAASGTPGPPVGTDPTQECNTDSVSAAVTVTGASSAGTTPCVSSAGAFDMSGNVWEWSADLTGLPVVAPGFQFTTTDAVAGVILGGSYNSGSSNTAADLATRGSGPDFENTEIGFRCVR